MTSNVVVDALISLLLAVRYAFITLSSSTISPAASAQQMTIESAGDRWWVTPLVTLVSVGVGAYGTYLFGERSTKNRDRAAASRVRSSVRTLLSIELENNLTSLVSIWKEVTEDVSSSSESGSGSEDSRSPSMTEMASRFSQRPLPKWSQLMWQSQASHLVTALSVSEMNLVHKLHVDAQRLAAYHQALREVATNDQLRPRTKEIDFVFARSIFDVPEQFPYLAQKLWPEIAKLFESIVESENPLRKTDSDDS